jgi:hypothetical protein
MNHDQESTANVAQMDDDTIIRLFQEEALKQRGDTEFDVAAGTTRAAIDEVEKSIGLVIPALYARVLMEASDGGMGPGGGVRRVASLLGTYISEDDNRASIAFAYERMKSYNRKWPKMLLPICSWGGPGERAMTCVDCSDPANTIVTVVGFDDLTRTHWTLRSWLQDWITGRIQGTETFEFEHSTSRNPFNGESMKRFSRRARVKPI